MKYFKTTILALLLAGIGLAAFRLSFDAQVTLATAAGVAGYLAGLYPLIVDAAIVAGVLIRLWNPELSKGLAGYLWVAIGFWTVTSILGNAFHVLALPPGRVELPPIIAIGVNTLPALTLFLVIHLATTTAFRRKPAVPPSRTKAAGRRLQAGLTTISEERAAMGQALARTDVPPVSDAELLAMAEEQGLSMSQIADRIGRSKSYVGDRVKKLRDERAAVSA